MTVYPVPLDIGAIPLESPPYLPINAQWVIFVIMVPWPPSPVRHLHIGTLCFITDIGHRIIQCLLMCSIRLAHFICYAHTLFLSRSILPSHRYFPSSLILSFCLSVSLPHSPYLSLFSVIFNSLFFSLSLYISLTFPFSFSPYLSPSPFSYSSDIAISLVPALSPIVSIVLQSSTAL